MTKSHVSEKNSIQKGKYDHKNHLINDTMKIYNVM